MCIQGKNIFSQISIAILGGGNSYRFGGDKKMATIGDTTIVEYMMAKLSPLTDDIFLQISSLQQQSQHQQSQHQQSQHQQSQHQQSQHQPQQQPLRQQPTFRTNSDIISGGGPLSGLHGALSICKYPQLWLVACDLVGVEPRLLDVLAHHGPGDIVMPRWKNGFLEPVCALYSKSLLPDVSGMLLKKTFRMSALVDRVQNVRFVEIESLIRDNIISPNTFSNINTPGDLEHWMNNSNL